MPIFVSVLRRLLIVAAFLVTCALVLRGIHDLFRGELAPYEVRSVPRWFSPR
jgi:hypothetical protein